MQTAVADLAPVAVGWARLTIGLGAAVIVLTHAFGLFTTRVPCSEDGLIVERGILMRRTDHREGLRVRDLAVVQPLWLLPCGAGHIIIWSTALTSPALMLFGLRRAQPVMLLLSVV